MFKIDKNIPMTVKRATYPFGEMEVGDSFLVTEPESINKVRSAAQKYAKDHYKKFSSRSTISGLRVWRVA